MSRSTESRSGKDARGERALLAGFRERPDTEENRSAARETRPARRENRVADGNPGPSGVTDADVATWFG
jgi:hypothetical protein